LDDGDDEDDEHEEESDDDEFPDEDEDEIDDDDDDRPLPEGLWQERGVIECSDRSFIAPKAGNYTDHCAPRSLWDESLYPEDAEPRVRGW
jgi:hypothetical protein